MIPLVKWRRTVSRGYDVFLEYVVQLAVLWIVVFLFAVAAVDTAWHQFR